MHANHTTAALLERGAERLAAASSSARLDAEVLLAHVLGVARARLRSHPEETPGVAARRAYESLLERRVAGEPLAYLVGYRDFWTLRLKVTPAVLVPRPETELLVERALEACMSDAAQVADLGTGSGAIALALASERPGWHVVASDLSGAALAVARQNAAELGIHSVEFLQGRWFEPLGTRRFDLVLSNPPYVSSADPVLSAAPLRFEPLPALTTGGDALEDLLAIIAAAPAHLVAGGVLLLEHGADQAPALARALVARGFGHVRSHRDLAGHERVTEARWS